MYFFKERNTSLNSIFFDQIQNKNLVLCESSGYSTRAAAFFCFVIFVYGQ
jgi:hypothetical protein